MSDKMQVVIEVPDVIYEMVKNTGTYGMYRFNSTEAIRKGIPLLKENLKMGCENCSQFYKDNCQQKEVSIIESDKTYRIPIWYGFAQMQESVKPETDVIDKIRSEIETNTKQWDGVNTYGCFVKLSDVLEIIDKYKAESEEKE